MIKKCYKEGKSATPAWFMSVDIAGGERTRWCPRLQLMKGTVLAESFSPGSLCSSDVYRHESDRFRTLLFFLTFFIVLWIWHYGFKFGVLQINSGYRCDGSWRLYSSRHGRFKANSPRQILQKMCSYYVYCILALCHYHPHCVADEPWYKRQICHWW